MIIGIDIGGSKTHIGLSYSGESLDDSVCFETPQNQRKIIATLASEIKKLVGGQEIDAIGISSPGPLNKAKGMITAPHNLAWHNLRFVTPLKKVFHCPIVLEHDATAAGIYEAKFGAGVRYRLVSYITISTGIGNSLILEGKPVSNGNNPEGGSQIIDYQSLSRESRDGKYSVLASGSAIERDYGLMASEITRREQWNLIARRLAYGIYNIIQISAPDSVILGGGTAVYFKRFAKQLMRELKALDSVYPLPPIMRAKYVETAPLLGAIYLAAKELDN